MNTPAQIGFSKRFMTLVVFFLLSTISMSGQEAKSTEAVQLGTVAVASATQSNSQMELVMWIMGTQTQVKSNTITNSISTNGSEKKKFINLGMTPNRILSKTLLKKAASRDMATV